MKSQYIEYRDGDVTLEGYYVYNDEIAGTRPAVLVAHDWSGRTELACQKAEKLAELGYAGFALDMYGKGIIGNTLEERTALIKPFFADRAAVRKRMLATYNTVKKLEGVDATRIGAIGFCFGGMCVLDLARSGADLRGVVSFHGIFVAPENLPNAAIKAKILALQGHDDPMVPPAQVLALETELTQAKADWQIHLYGNTMHAFTNPAANDPKLGTVYNAVADKRSWVAMKNFLSEIF